MNSLELRQRFIQFFKSRGHHVVKSSSLIPSQDPTLLFTNAGMNQFKDLFLGKEKRSYTRAVSIQKCVRAGGKHNDLDNVGFTTRHLTFFEMMGNFSFGDYFKKDAIIFAWDLLTKDLSIPTHNMHITIYETDEESYNIWHNIIGVPAHLIHRLGEKDNFWQMGDLGPCGPCTEIHIDRGPTFGCKDITDCGPSCDCDRFIEIWNLVFMQFDRQADGSLKPLEQTGVDTGMGLERLCSIIQNKDSIFETDIFVGIIAAIEQATDKKYTDKNDIAYRAAFHVLADHGRSSSLLIADGCMPSNDGRGYVLRKIIRRAALFAQKLTSKNIFPEIINAVIKSLGSVYPELVTSRELIIKTIVSEVEKFSANLIRGQQLLQRYIQHTDSKIISGEEAFKMYDTYGFPLELIHVMAHEHGFTVNIQEFEKQMEKQQKQSGKKLDDPLDHLDFGDSVKTEFTGYQELETRAPIVALIVGNEIVETVPEGSTCWVLTSKSPFFIVGGGQVPDQGWLKIDEYQIPIQEARHLNGRIGVRIKTPTTLIVGTTVTSIVNEELRTNAMKNHTATHLLQAALIEILGDQVKQSGSLVHPDYLRFDFSYHAAIELDKINQVEQLVNQKIQQNIPVAITYGTLQEAKEKGALAFFGEKYNPEQVRMVDIPNFSIELCGGTHVHATGEIGVFKITEVNALAAGYRRIVAVTGPRAVELFQNTFATVKALSQELKTKREDVLDVVLKSKEQIKTLNHEMNHLKQQLWANQVPAWLKESKTINGVSFLFLLLKNQSHEELKEVALALSNKQPGLYFLVSGHDDQLMFVSLVSSALTQKLNLKTLIKKLAQDHEIRGGGSSQMMQGAGKANINKLRNTVEEWLVQVTA